VSGGFLYNLTVTALSVAVALVIGTIEVGGLISSDLDLSGSFWNWCENVDLDFLGFVIVAMFIATWVIAFLVWRLGRIEERWSTHLGGAAGSREPIAVTR
jgi:high-affinity nickel-transport protein